MSDDYFKSSSNSYSSSYEYKPSGYTDFSSSSSYSSDSDSDKKYDDYSGYSSEGANNQQNYQSYSYDNSNNSSSSYESSYEDSSKRIQVQSNNSYQTVAQHDEDDDHYRSNSTLNNQNTFASQVSDRAPSKLQSMTIRDVLELPLDRQEYLKSLDKETLKSQPEVITVMKRPNIVLGIVDYYNKSIPDEAFNMKVKQIRQGKDLRQVVFLTSMLGYIYMYNNFKLLGPLQKMFETKFHLMIPATLIMMIIKGNSSTKKKTEILINDQMNTRHVDHAVRKFICEANRKQKMDKKDLNERSDTFHSPTNSERFETATQNLKSSLTLASKKSKYSTRSKLTTSKLFAALNKTKVHDKQVLDGKNMQLDLLQNSLANLENFKKGIAHKLSKQIICGLDCLDSFLEMMDKE